MAMAATMPKRCDCPMCRYAMSLIFWDIIGANWTKADRLKLDRHAVTLARVHAVKAKQANNPKEDN